MINIAVKKKGSGLQMPDPISWLIIGICLLGHFFFSACETSLACCNKYKISAEAEEGNKRAKLVSKVLDNYDRALTAVLVGNNIVAVVISTISALLFYGYFKGTGMENSSSLISSIIMAIIVYIFGDTLPKTIAKAIPDTLSKMFIYPLYFFIILFFPIAKVFEWMVLLLSKIFKVKDENELTEEEFGDIVEELSSEGDIEPEVGEIIQSALEFDDTNVKEVLTPIEKMFFLDINGLTPKKINEILLTCKYSRIPIYNSNANKFIGVLYVKKYIKEYLKNPELNIRKVLNKPYFVTTRIMLDNLFKGFKKNRSHIALVKNNAGDVVGMVTMEDILEEIVGEIGEPSLARKK